MDKAAVVVKLGGSAITNKAIRCMPRLNLIHRAASEIAAYEGQLILLHGGGSFAHPFATKQLLRSRFKDRSQLKTASEIELNLGHLTRIVGVALLLNNKPFMPIQPLSFLTLRDGEVKECFLKPISALLRLGTVPLIHGDLALDERRGFAVISADRIASLLGERMQVSRVLFGCDVDGVYEDYADQSSPPQIVSEINEKNHVKILDRLDISTGDVTGGMRGKVLEALRLAQAGVESYIFNLKIPSNLSVLLNGGTSIGTRFLPWN